MGFTLWGLVMTPYNEFVPFSMLMHFWVRRGKFRKKGTWNLFLNLVQFAMTWSDCGTAVSFSVLSIAGHQNQKCMWIDKVPLNIFIYISFLTAFTIICSQCKCRGKENRNLCRGARVSYLTQIQCYWLYYNSLCAMYFINRDNFCASQVFNYFCLWSADSLTEVLKFPFIFLPASNLTQSHWCDPCFCRASGHNVGNVDKGLMHRLE